MRIYKMTATFGKLEHATLELKPGLNIITAPNEWGKSTWCAFLAAMLYGMDTRAKSTKTVLADKEHYAPWSGAPMAGRIDLNWNGRDITIERKTKRRVPLGEFQAYETASGLAVPELTAANCGAMLLGVEQSVYRRAGFIRLADLPVTQDEALRRRLNALVTTGDDSDAGDRLADSLRELKNRCRYNRTGLLPQAEAQRDELDGKLREWETLEHQVKKLGSQLEEVTLWLEQLKNHQQNLDYARLQANTVHVTQAREALEQTEEALERLEMDCAGLPPLEETERTLREVKLFREQWMALQAELRMLPPEPRQPQMTGMFAGMTEETAREMVRKDAKAYVETAGSKAPVLLVCVGIFGLLAAAGLLFLRAYLFAAVAGITGLVCLVWGLYERTASRKHRLAFLEKYGNGNWKTWMTPVEEFAAQMAQYREARKEYDALAGDLEVRLMVLQNKRDLLCGSLDPDRVLESWQEAQESWQAYYAMEREAQQERRHYAALQAMIKPVEKPTMPDELTQSAGETAQLIADCTQEQQRLQNRLGQHQGRMELLGSQEALLRQRKQLEERIAKLEDTYTALAIAQETLAQARAELQRRFAPQITRRAQEFLSAMTGGRYHSLSMSDDFSLLAGAGEEDTLWEAQWRSDGTMDQLYLALRLAVAEALTPEAPLVLDDALVRFDDQRMGAAVRLLEEMGRDKQVILFTCQGREARI